MTEIAFARPEVFVALSLLAAFPIAWVVGRRRTLRHARSLSRTARPASGLVPGLVVMTAFALAIVAAAQPTWGTHSVPVLRTGADVVFVLDVSRSMNAEDVPPSRLSAARSAVVSAMQRGGANRVGLVVFGGTAHQQFPLTTDASAASLVVDRLESGSVFVSGGSVLWAALDLARGSFDPESEAGRLVVLITDGDNLGDDPIAAAARLEAEDISLLVAGVGTAAGARIPIFNQQGTEQEYLADGSGPIISRLNEQLLVDVANAGGGRYLGNSIESLPGAVASRVTALETARLAETPAEVPVERFGGFSLAAAVLLSLVVLGAALPVLFGQRRRTTGLVLAVLAAASVVAACARPSYELNEDGLEAFRAGDYEAAIEAFSAAAAEDPADAELALNLALAYHAAERYGDAGQAAERASRSTNRDVRLAALKALGHHRFAQQDYVSALAAFHDALILDPNDEMARHDYGVTWSILNPPPAPPDSPTPPPAQSPAAETPTPGGGEPGTPGPGDPTPQPTTTPPADPGAPSPGPGSSESEIETRIAQIDQEVRSIEDEAGEALTAEQALRILELNAERNRLSSLLESGQDSSDPADR